MSRNPRYDPLFEPLAIGPVVARNRFYQVPHASGTGCGMPHTRAGLREVKAESQDTLRHVGRAGKLQEVASALVGHASGCWRNAQLTPATSSSHWARRRTPLRSPTVTGRSHQRSTRHPDG